MSLQLIARDLYRLQQEVDRLEKKLADAPSADRDSLKMKLARAKTERDEMRRMLDGRLDR
jgi:outer membrane murein-binding lipoprotein Lpp